MKVTVKVSADVARILHKRGPPTADSEELVRTVERFDFTLVPMHRATGDPNLQRYFIVEVPDIATAQRLIDSLLQLKTIEGAYVTPPAELP